MVRISTSTLLKSGTPTMLKAAKFSLLTAPALAALMALGVTPHASAQQSAEQSETAAPKGFSFEAKRGAVLQVIAPDAKEGARDARQAYYEQTLPRAEPLGFRRHGQLNVRQKVISDFDPGAFIFFSWPDQASFSRFEADLAWPAIAASRPEGWDELRIYSLELQEDLALSFDPDKHYTVVVAWLEDDGAADYDRYLDGIEPAMQRAGGRFLYKMRMPSMEAHNSPPASPGQITFVEWDSTDGFAEVQKSAEYQAHQQYFRSGVDRFEFYWLQTRR